MSTGQAVTFTTRRGRVTAEIVAFEREHTSRPTVIARVVNSTDPMHPAGQTVCSSGKTLY